jgi:CRP-like cAMP-binding protein
MNLKEAQTEIRLHLPLKHWEIAELIAVTPEHLSRVLKRMEREGIMRREKGRTVIVNYQKLEDVVSLRV